MRPLCRALVLLAGLLGCHCSEIDVSCVLGPCKTPADNITLASQYDSLVSGFPYDHIDSSVTDLPGALGRLTVGEEFTVGPYRPADPHPILRIEYMVSGSGLAIERTGPTTAIVRAVGPGEASLWGAATFKDQSQNSLHLASCYERQYGPGCLTVSSIRIRALP